MSLHHAFCSSIFNPTYFVLYFRILLVMQFHFGSKQQEAILKSTEIGIKIHYSLLVHNWCVPEVTQFIPPCKVLIVSPNLET